MATREQAPHKTDALRVRAEAVVGAEATAVRGMDPATLQQLVHELDVHQVELELQNEELRRIQLELQDARDRYAELYDFAPVGYATLDDAGVIRQANLTLAKLLGVERATLVGLRLTKFVAADDQDLLYRHRRQTAGATLPQSCQLRLTRPDRTALVVELESVALRGPDERVRGCRIALVDTTARRQAENEHKALAERLREAQKLEAVGRLAGGVAHDFNNILTVVLGNAELLRADFAGYVPVGDTRWHCLDRIQEAGERAAQLTRRLLTFGRRQLIPPDVVSPAFLVSTFGDLLRRLMREDVDLRINCEPDVWPIKADPVQIEQMIVNLVANARDALPQGGAAALSVTNVIAEARDARPSGGATAPYVLFAVSDNGVGMDDAARARLFEPFFTTKPVGKGTGLGLATVYAIVQQAGGYIEVESQLSRGSTFRVFWPATSEALPTVPATERLPEPATGSETVLVCEDNEAVRDLLVRTLRDRGYTVLAAVDGSEALRVAESHAAPMHLLVTDVVMPNMNGKELAAALARTHPALKVLLMSGYADDVIGEHGVLSEDAHFMQKPFSPTDLLRRVRRILDE